MSKKKQSTLDSFLADFSAESDGSGLRPEWKPERDQVHQCEIVDATTVSNEWGESTMVICIVEGEERVWFLKGNENRDFEAFRVNLGDLHWDVNEIPPSVEFARTQKQSSRNADRQVNRLFIRLAE